MECMLRNLVLAAIATVYLTSASTLAAAESIDGPSLLPGDAAPALKVDRFLKGDEISQFEKGRVYVVECWATWCGPCLKSIPHLTELQKKNPKITVLGVCVSDPDIEAIETFVKEQGDDMGYTVAWEGKPPGRNKQPAFTKTWLDAAGAQGIPHAFVVDGKGIVAWMGHPMEMDDALEKIIAGEWDAKAFREKLIADREAEQKMAALMEEFGTKLDECEQAGDTDGMLAVFDEFESTLEGVAQQEEVRSQSGKASGGDPCRPGKGKSRRPVQHASIRVRSR
jgi:thiol-disulfide isomerase/thioredoxin